MSRVIARILGAVFAAVALGAFGAYLGWQTARPLPSNAEALRMVEPALPAKALGQPQRWDFVFDRNPKYTDPRWLSVVLGTDEYVHGKVFFRLAFPNDTSRSASVEVLRQRMLAAGWRSASTDLAGCCPESDVHREGWIVEIMSEGDIDESHHELQLAVTRARPDLVMPLTAAGVLVGVVAGWLTGAWVLGRFRQADPPKRTVATAVLSGGLAALLPATVMSAIALVLGYLLPYDLTPAWVGYTFLLFRPLAYLGVIAVAGGLLLAVVPLPRR